jgi:hypothetical protein
VKSQPETEIVDKRLTFSTQNPSIEPSYKTAPKAKTSVGKNVDFSKSARFFDDFSLAA